MDQFSSYAEHAKTLPLPRTRFVSRVTDTHTLSPSLSLSLSWKSWSSLSFPLLGVRSTVRDANSSTPSKFLCETSHVSIWRDNFEETRGLKFTWFIFHAGGFELVTQFVPSEAT